MDTPIRSSHGFHFISFQPPFHNPPPPSPQHEIRCVQTFDNNQIKKISRQSRKFLSNKKNKYEKVSVEFKKRVSKCKMPKIPFWGLILFPEVAFWRFCGLYCIEKWSRNFDSGTRASSKWLKWPRGTGNCFRPPFAQTTRYNFQWFLDFKCYISQPKWLLWDTRSWKAVELYPDEKF